MATKKAQTAPRPALATKQPTALILAFCEYLEAETGYAVDPQSVYLGSMLRADFQKSPANQKRIQSQLAQAAAERTAKEKRAADREAKAAAKAAAPKPQPAKKSTTAKKAEPVKKATKAAPAPQRRRPLKVEATA